MNAAREDRTLHTTQPHGSQDVLLHEDDPKPANRIFVIRNEDDRWVPILGSEVESLCSWWEGEQEREGDYEEPGSGRAKLPDGRGADLDEADECRKEALDALQSALDALGPLTDEASYVQREAILELVDRIYEVGEDLQDIELDTPEQ